MAREVLYDVKQKELLRDFLKDKISNKALKKVKDKGAIYVNDEIKTVRYLLNQGDVVKIIFPLEEKGRQMEAIHKEFRIVYEDDYFLVIDKEKGIPCIPNHRYHESLANYILDYYQKHRIDTTVHFINRLDKDTSGLLLLSKYRHEQYLLSKSKIQRKYVCVVYGKLVGSDSVIAPIYQDGQSIKRVIDAKGVYAKTNYNSLFYKNGYTVVECELETGRTHQIRVHLASIGHPIVGDRLYGETKQTIDGQLLDSYYLSFYHPYKKEKITFKKKKERWRNFYD